ncbi:hypothetical protein D9619_000166 [Psilocybe cf. subviscida]|uniref:Uncharacterized protein n=1 Tax=Psilocybe cf. subviscida TaxID=2480587 RepID=A0A8H5BFU6_9AGAR|nr:hypothetical protein D9619_000166 [Psilocybe cf. subviscida]
MLYSALYPKGTSTPSSGSMVPAHGQHRLDEPDLQLPSPIHRRALLARRSQGRFERRSPGRCDLFYHENHNKNGEPSLHVYALTNKHVLGATVDADHEFRSVGSPREYVRLVDVNCL